MMQLVGCPDITCKHNHDGNKCMCCTPNHETITINNKTYNVCQSYEESEEYKCQLKKQ